MTEAKYSTKFVLISPERKVVVGADNADLSIPEMVELFRSFLLAAGYEWSNVRHVTYEETVSDEEE